jgi:BirA family biotin operon repressor/biotin-[acetyl-CoA-carboxylase] ligase
MKIKKISTTRSTNDYLKDWSRKEVLENFTVVVAEEQTAGRGQRENIWHSEKGKNLTFSMLIRLGDFEVSRQFELNQAVSLGLLMAIKKVLSKNFSSKIKWPNDILVNEKKIAGILIENTISGSKIKQSVVGIGLNVNQINLPASLPNASSLQALTTNSFDLDILLKELVLSIQNYIFELEQNADFMQEYLQNLFQFKKDSQYLSNKNNIEFTGKIVGVSSEGKLDIQTKNGILNTYNFKEITFLL